MSRLFNKVATKNIALNTDAHITAMYWFGYELLKADLMRRSNSDQTTVVQSFVAGAVSGTVRRRVDLTVGSLCRSHEVQSSQRFKRLVRVFKNLVFQPNSLDSEWESFFDFPVLRRTAVRKGRIIPSHTHTRARAHAHTDTEIVLYVQVAGVVTLPFDVVKTHRQIELGQKIINSECGMLLCSSKVRSVDHLCFRLPGRVVGLPVFLCFVPWATVCSRDKGA